MKLYLIYAIVPSNLFSTRIKYLINNVKDFKEQGKNRVGLYAWTTSKMIMEEFLEGRDEDIYKITKKDDMDKEDIKKFRDLYPSLELGLFHFCNKHSESEHSGEGLDIVTTKFEFVNSVLDISENITGFGYPTYALFDYHEFNMELQKALEMINYNYYYDISNLPFSDVNTPRSKEDFNEVSSLLYLYRCMFTRKGDSNETVSDIH